MLSLAVGHHAAGAALSYGLRGKTCVWKSGRSVAETRTRSVFWVYMTYRNLSYDRTELLVADM